MITRQRLTKIVATVGAVSRDLETLRALIRAGVDVFRLNFSHGTQAEHSDVIGRIRLLEQELGYPLGILCDLQGPKLRVGTFQDDEALLKPGQLFTLDLGPAPGNSERVLFPHPTIYPYLTSGTQLLLDDGRLRLEVAHATPTQITTRVQVGGVLRTRKGVNIPNREVPISALTDKDRADVAFLATKDVDFIGLSFVQKAEDVRELRALLPDHIKILAKIEKPLAVRNIDSIIQESDGIMIARGDLGIEMPIEEVPSTQKRLIDLTKKYGKPVLVATQMLESMMTSETPTRAEVSDVANAVYDDTDGVMLSGESAAGDHPVKAVEMMNRILETTERDPHYKVLMKSIQAIPDATAEDAIALAAKEVAETVNAGCIVTCSVSGRTALRVAKQRPLRPILCVTPTLSTARALTLSWGVFPQVVPIAREMGPFLASIKNLKSIKSILNTNDCIVITGGSPLASPGTTNFIYVEKILI